MEPSKKKRKVYINPYKNMSVKLAKYIAHKLKVRPIEVNKANYYFNLYNLFQDEKIKALEESYANQKNVKIDRVSTKIRIRKMK